MGFGVAAATAVLAATAVGAGYSVTGAWFDTTSQLNEARLVAEQLQSDSAWSAFTITNLVRQQGSGHVTLTLENTGGVTLDAADLHVLLDGLLYTGEDITITGHTGTLWHPAEILTLFFHGTQDLNSVYKTTAVNRAAVSAGNGAMAFWGV